MPTSAQRRCGLRAAGCAVDEPALESLKVQHKVWLSQKKKSSKAGETDKKEVEDEKVESQGERKQ